MKHEILFFRKSNAKLYKAVFLIAFQIFVGNTEVVRSRPLHGLIFLSLAQQDCKMETGFAVQLIVHLQVLTIHLQTIKWWEAFPGVLLELLRQGPQVAGCWSHVEENVVCCEPQEFR